MYYLQSRYYNPEWGRFINADGIIGQTGELLSHNLFAYCGNDPVNRLDPDGDTWGFVEEFFTNLTNSITSFKSAYASAGAIAISDGPLPIGDAIGFAIAGAATIGAIAYAGYKTVTSTKTKAIPLNLPKDNKPIIFPNSPYEFNPNGCIRREFPGKKNGKIIKWFPGCSKVPVFEWNEDIKNGAHYHVMQIEWDGKHIDGKHYYPGENVPEPFATVYFR